MIPENMSFSVFAARPLRSRGVLVSLVNTINATLGTPSHFSFDDINWFTFSLSDFLASVARDCGEQSHILLARKTRPVYHLIFSTRSRGLNVLNCQLSNFTSQDEVCSLFQAIEKVVAFLEPLFAVVTAQGVELGARYVIGY